MFKKLAKVIGLLGGAAVLLWTMRDRFVSISTSREPEPPVFRTKTEMSTTSVTVIDGIGPTFADRLSRAGIDSVEALAAASPDAVAEAAGVSGARARSWIDQASQTA